VSEHPVTAAYAGVLLFIVGLAIGGGGLELNRRERERMQGWSRADGSIVFILAAPGASKRTGKALVGFQTSSGDRITFTSPPRIGFRTLRSGEAVSVLYDPADPSRAVIDPRAARWTRNALLAAASAILAILGASVAWYARGRMLTAE
jgi:hypothetical protein